jgi:hypothetical protein
VAREQSAMALATIFNLRAARERDGTRHIMPITRSQHEAAQKARQCLLRLLTAEQRQYYRRYNLVVVGTATASYEISLNSIVKAHRDGREYGLCIQFAHPADGAWLPAEDLMIAKLLLIRTDEDGMWKRFAPPPYGERWGQLQDANLDIARAGSVYATVYLGPPVHFTENLEPIAPRTLPRRLPPLLLPNPLDGQLYLQGNNVEP